MTWSRIALWTRSPVTHIHKSHASESADDCSRKLRASRTDFFLNSDKISRRMLCFLCHDKLNNTTWWRPASCRKLWSYSDGGNIQQYKSCLYTICFRGLRSHRLPTVLHNVTSQIHHAAQTHFRGCDSVGLSSFEGGAWVTGIRHKKGEGREEKLIVVQLVRFSEVYWTRRCISV
jgi:hypothetical protein